MRSFPTTRRARRYWRSHVRTACGFHNDRWPSSRRRIGVITTSRADYSHLYWPLRELAAHPEVELGVFALGAHLSPEFGNTMKEIERDGFPIQARIECLLSSDSDTGMAKTIGLAILGLADALTAWRPDMLLLIADRYEMLAPASVALALRIPIAHIEGGEVARAPSTTRCATHSPSSRTSTSLPRHCAAARDSHGRGALARPSRRRTVARPHPPFQASRPHRARIRLGTRAHSRRILAAWHPVTILRDTNAEADAFFAALAQGVPAN